MSLQAQSPQAQSPQAQSPQEQRSLVIRFSSLGDVVLCGAVTGGLAPVTFLTKRAFAEVAAALPGVVEVRVWEEVQAGRQRLDGPWAQVVDLHASPRSRRVCAGLRAPVRRVARHDLRRRLRVWLKVGAPPPTVVARYAAAAQLPPAPLPWLSPAAQGTALGLVPGASAATKRWPAERFVALGQAWPGPVVVLGGPDEGERVQAVALAIGPRARAVAERGFATTLPALRDCAVLVAGDTGLLHLAAALGVRVVGLFGPTTSRDGFWSPAAGTALEAPLPCRPCSLHGGATCPVGDHLCMGALSVEHVQAVLLP